MLKISLHGGFTKRFRDASPMLAVDHDGSWEAPFFKTARFLHSFRWQTWWLAQADWLSRRRDQNRIGIGIISYSRPINWAEQSTSPSTHDQSYAAGLVKTPAAVAGKMHCW